MNRTAPAVPIPEVEFSRAVVDVAHRGGWRVAHFGTGIVGDRPRTPARYDGVGFPDLVLVHPGRRLVLFRELKAGTRPNRALDAPQRRWLDDLSLAGADADVWRPVDAPEIYRFLSAGRMEVQ